jgi:aryl-alcohol dehydrogenase-like predicted oxidoreductase
MEYTRLGATGLEVSRICLGCMSFGVPDRGNHTWTLDEDASRPVLQRALELGVNFLDTANVYSDGTSEEIVGRALRDLTRREDVVLATKVHGACVPARTAAGLSRKAIMTEIDASLRRLGTDHVDLYQIHRWDPHTPVEETMEALHDVVKAGKARYLGASSMWAWQFAKAQSTPSGTAGRRSSRCRTTTTCSTARRSARCSRCAPTRASASSRGARSRAAGWRGVGRGHRALGDRRFGQTLYVESDRTIVERVARWPASSASRGRRSRWPGCSRSPSSPRPIVGATKLSHLEDAVAAVDVRLDDAVIARLEEPYAPHAVVGF